MVKWPKNGRNKHNNIAVHKKLILELIEIHSWLLAKQGLDQIKVPSSENVMLTMSEVSEGHWIMCNAIVSVVVQSLVYHWFLDTEYPSNLFYYEIFYALEVWDMGLQVMQDMATGYTVMVMVEKEKWRWQPLVVHDWETSGVLPKMWPRWFFQNVAISYKSENSCKLKIN